MDNQTGFALITGASSGIGYEFAKIIAQEKINLVLVARNKSVLENLADELKEKQGIQVLTFPVDLSAEGSAKDVYEFTSSNNIQITYLLNNAGIGDYTYFPDADLTKTQEMINLNISALTNLCRLYLSGMLKNKSGKILNVSSVAAFQPGPLMSAYYASKAYVLSFSQALRRELKGTGVGVTCLCPGPTKSNFWKTANAKTSMLTSLLKLPESVQVARFGWKALKKNKSIAIYGISNKLLVFSERFIPRYFATDISYILNKSKE